MSKPPKIVIPGLNRGIGVPPGYVLGRMPGTGQGPAQLLNMGSLRKLGMAGASGVAQSTSTAISTAHSENISLKTSVSTSLSQISSSLSGTVSSTGSLSTAVSTVISGSISTVNSRIDSLSTAVGGGGGVDDDSALSTSLSSAVSVNTTQSTSLSQISSSLSGAISSTSSLSTAVSTVDSNQSTSLSQISSSLSAEISTDLSRINSLSTAVGGGGGATTGEATLTVPVAADYTLQNTGTSSDTTVSNGIYFSVPSTSPAQIRFLKNTVGPGLFSSFTIIARCKMAAIVSTTAASYIGAIVLRNSVSGKILIFTNAYQGGSQYLMQRWTDYATFSANVLGPTAYGGAAPNFYWMKVTVGGGTATFYLSPDGVNWASVGTETVATFIGSIDQVGVGSMSNGTDASCVFSSISIV